MNIISNHDQGTIVLAQQDYLPILIDSFLTDLRAQGLSPEKISFYKRKLGFFITDCEGQAGIQVSQLTPDLLRRCILELTETHKSGGLHACFMGLQD